MAREHRGSVRLRLLAIVTLLLMAGFLTTNLISFGVSRAALKATILQNELPLTSSNIYAEIQADLLRPIFVSSLMSNDTFLRDWLLAGEKEPDKITRYLEEIRQKYGVFTSFLISGRTHQYYHFTGPSRIVDETDEREAWYPRVRGMHHPYEINIDYNQAQNDAMTVFVNYRVLDYDNKFLGVTGVGLKFDAVTRILSRHGSSHSRNIYFIDRTGRITVRSQDAPLTEASIRDAAGIREIADDLLSKTEGYFEYQRNDETMLVTTRLVRELGWMVMVEQREADAIRGLWRGFYTNLVIGLLIIAGTVTAILYTINLYQRRLEVMATTDKLTGIANREAFDATLADALHRRRRTGQPLALILFDLDHFKRINDTRGHLTGDAVIQAVVGVIRSTLRASDVACRWGGEEFIALLDACGLDQATLVAGSIRAAVAELVIPASDGDLRVTISAGVAEALESDTADSLLSRADAALYQAKEQGRNRVVTASTDIISPTNGGRKGRNGNRFNGGPATGA